MASSLARSRRAPKASNAARAASNSPRARLSSPSSKSARASNTLVRAQSYGALVCSFGLGSKKLYDTIDHNVDFSCQPVETTNLPHLVMQNDRLTTINNTTQMDLQGQAASESSGHRHISGTGGQLQFVRAGYASNGGKSFICMSSTYERAGVRASRVVLNLTPGNVVTAPRSDVMFVVTEHGMVNLKGKSIPERAKAMISLAHPDFRDDLERDARTSGLIPRSFV